jgi:VWFA-related protein
MIARLFAIVIFASAVVAPLPAAQPTTEVLVPVLVTGGDGLPVAGLEQGDFQLLADGQPHAMSSFVAGPSPVSVVLLLDTSASMDGRVQPGTAPIGLAAALQTWPSADELSSHRWQIGRISRSTALPATFSSEPGAIREGIRAVLDVPAVDRFGPSPVWDTVNAGLTALESTPGKRGVIVLTDGRATGNRLGVRDVILHAIAAGAPVNVISEARDDSMGLGDRQVLIVRPELALQLLTDQTGGSYVRAFSLEDATTPSTPAPQITSLLSRIVTELHQSYLLGFATTKSDGQVHKLDVKVSRPGLHVQTRKAYIVDAPR